jgi:23S rRNA (adenine2503-C2)-methyltransferase
MTRRYILDLDQTALEDVLRGWGEKPYRARQLLTWIYRKQVDSFARCSDIGRPLQERLLREFALYSFTLLGKEGPARDGTVRYNFRTHDGFVIAAVFLPSRDRNSVCISTQAGCPVGCVFCATGRMRFKRNLSRGEILEQILRIENDSGRRIGSVLLMGMGEPLLNCDNVVSAVRAMVDFRELALGRRHIILSTSGIVAQMRRLADEKLGIRLAVSLHAADDRLRRRLVPTATASVNDILEAGLYYSRKNRSKLTVEYTLVAGVNDTLQAVQKLVKLLQSHTRPKDEIQINLIPCNRTAARAAESPEEAAVARFQNYLEKHGILALVREAKGVDIGAGCGQLGV